MPNFGKGNRGVASDAEGIRKQVRGLRFEKIQQVH
jgi:hypothetical protein